LQPIEELLRDQLRRADKALPSTRDAMLARVAKARRRRSAAAAAGLTVVVIAAAAALAGMLGAHPGQQTGNGLPQRLYSAELLNVVFTDAQHGYVLQERCSEEDVGELPAGAPTPDVHRECIAALLATVDAGQTWHERTLPAEPATKDAGVDLEFGHSLMLWVDSPGTIAFGSGDRRYWTTVDGGATWAESPTPRDVGPAGSFGTFGIGDRPAFLATVPPGYFHAGSKTPVIAATDGSFWIRCPDSACVRVTRDSGLSWPTVPVPADAVDWVSTVDGVTVYAGVRATSGPRLLGSADGGATWTGVTALPQRGAGGLALANGDVLIANSGEAGGLLRVKAGSSTPEPLTGAPAHGVIYGTGGIVVAASAWGQRPTPDLDSVVSISTDGGTTWMTIPPPAP
jgi:hypothetical protein